MGWKDGLNEQEVKEIETAVQGLPAQDAEKASQILAELKLTRRKYEDVEPLPELLEFAPCDE